MSEIRSKPSTREFRDNFDRIFRKMKNPVQLNSDWSLKKETNDENIDWGEFKTECCCTDDPNFGG